MIDASHIPKDIVGQNTIFNTATPSLKGYSYYKTTYMHAQCTIEDGTYKP